MGCTHPKTFIVATEFWNGAKYETQFHCGKCSRRLKKEMVKLRNGTTRTKFVERDAR